MGDRSIGDGESRHPEHDAEDADDGPREPTHDAAIERETDPDDPRYRPLVPDDDPDAVPPPARPVMSDRTRPPVLRPLPAPRSIRTSRSLWILSFVLGAFGVLLAFLSHAAVTTELTEVIGRLSPTYDESEVDALVDVVYWTSLAGMGIVVAVEAALLAFMMNRRGGARWLLLIALVLQGGVVLMGSAFLAVGDVAVPVELLLVGGFVVAFAAWVCSLAPSAHRWFRMKDEAQLAALD